MIAATKGATFTDGNGLTYTDYHAAFAPPRPQRPGRRWCRRGCREDDQADEVGVTEIEVGRASARSCPVERALTETGSEATFHAIRVWAATGRRHVIKFRAATTVGDSVAMNVISPPENVGRRDPLSKGVLPEVTEATIVCKFNDEDEVERALAEHDVAAIILEPIPHNIGAVLPQPGFLERLRELATAHGTVLIFDEVITGFRHALGGYQSIAGVTPDLTALGKAMGNGWPVSALGGKAELMDMFSTTPGRPAFFAGTFNGHPPTAAAALATIDKLQREPVHEHVFASASARGRAARADGRLGVPATSAATARFRHLLPGGHPDELRRSARERRRHVRGVPSRADGARHLRVAPEPQAQPFLVRPYRQRRRSPARGDRGGGADGSGPPRVTDPAVTCTIDLDAPGGGSACSPRSNTAGWYEFVPIATIGNGEGPTVLVLAAITGTSTRARRCVALIHELAGGARTDRGDPGDLDRRLQGQHPHVAVRRTSTGRSRSPDGSPDRQSTTSPASCSRWPTW